MTNEGDGLSWMCICTWSFAGLERFWSLEDFDLPRYLYCSRDMAHNVYFWIEHMLSAAKLCNVN